MYVVLATHRRFSNSGATSPNDVEATPPPLLGQHSRQVLTEMGFSGAKIDRLEGEGVVQTQSV